MASYVKWQQPLVGAALGHYDSAQANRLKIKVGCGALTWAVAFCSTAHSSIWVECGQHYKNDRVLGQIPTLV